MKTIEISQATGPLSEYIQQVQDEPLVVTENGSPTALLLSLSDIDMEDLALGMNPQFIALIERSRARAEAEGEVSAEEMRRRVLAAE